MLRGEKYLLGSLKTRWFESIPSSPAATLWRAAGCVASQKQKRYKGLNKEGVYCKKDRKDKAKSGTEKLKQLRVLGEQQVLTTTHLLDRGSALLTSDPVHFVVFLRRSRTSLPAEGPSYAFSDRALGGFPGTIH